ncbi:hypothetical protein [Pseudomonas syringae]|uniref:hypothetical protein n=1 Tax=Pseudomonas syringae TaxID=317 RepID=UPI001F39CF08|nr:hypothetical protein [Pseudomonas syringae]MCF5225041.1 hypothetical protein [Pseudomonas syringae]MCF5244133.1 hypothetical protein [Pseudomonas syringae]
MIRAIAVSGEGVTDLGVSRRGLGVTDGADIEVGPTLILIYKLIYLYAPDWYRDLYDWTADVPIPTFLVSRGERSRVTKTLKPNLFQTHASGRGGIEHAKGAWALAQIAMEYGADLCIYFHDTDGTQALLRRSPDLQDVIVKGASKGFEIQSVTGIAMVPKPTSEAWFICHAGLPPYQHCHILETSLAGNQDSEERSPKIHLANLIGKQRLVRDDLIELAHAFDVERINMPSFNQFRSDIKTAIESILGSRVR